jgi:hypothetical protein
MTWALTVLMAGGLLLFFGDAFLIGSSPLLLLAFAAIGLLVVAGFVHHAEHGPAGRLHPTPVLLASIAALGVMGISRGGLLSVEQATALVGIAGGIAERWGPSPLRHRTIAAPLYCGAFAGMTSELVLGHPGWVLLAGALAGMLLALLSNSWGGIGGKLGTTAFLAVAAASALALSMGAIGPGAPQYAYSQAEGVVVLIAAVLSPLVTQTLSFRYRLGVVLGSSLPSLLLAVLLPPSLAAAWLGGSFVGMTSPERLGPQPPAVLVAMGLLFAMFSLCYQPGLGGIGGDLGATAAVSVFAVLGARALLSALRRRH